jgi:hypothetical protein
MEETAPKETIKNVAGIDITAKSILLKGKGDEILRRIPIEKLGFRDMYVPFAIKGEDISSIHITPDYHSIFFKEPKDIDLFEDPFSKKITEIKLEEAI